MAVRLKKEALAAPVAELLPVPALDTEREGLPLAEAELLLLPGTALGLTDMLMEAETQAELELQGEALPEGL